MLIECPTCNALVNGMVMWSGPGEHFPYDPDPFTAYVLKCPGCGNMMFGAQAGQVVDKSGIYRHWPPSEERFALGAPGHVHSSLAEAEKCLKAGAFQACTVMAGRAIEGVCRHFGTHDVGLGNGIRELHEKGILDQRLVRWARELQVARNAAAHPGASDVSEPDARDLLDLAYAICMNVFELEDKFARFMDRRKRATAEEPGGADSSSQ